MASVGKADFDPNDWMFLLPLNGLNVLAAYKKEGDREELLFVQRLMKPFYSSAPESIE